jgi:DeoR/GlpR family transcriptional regulator of sugar metabolism
VGQEERLKYILQKLEMWGSVSTKELSGELQVSVVTLRKDFRLLEEQGKLSRVAGGAILCQENKKGRKLDYGSNVKNAELKCAVAKKAAKLIQDGDTLIATAGMTPHLTVVHAEGCKNLKVVTDSLITAEDLCCNTDYQVILLGGEIYERDSFVYGQDAVSQASRYMVDKAIVTMDGVDVKAGLTTLRVEGADTLKSILARARMKILVVDITKIGIESFCHVGSITDVDVLVTNWTDDPVKMEILCRIAEAGVIVEYAEVQDGEL